MIIRLLFFVWLFSSISYASMTQIVEKMISKNLLKRDSVSVHIVNTKTGKDIASINANISRKPASVMKILTTYSAILEMGSTFRWPTKFYYHGRYSKGVIDGDLIVKGYGDPSLCKKDISSIVKRLSAVGVKSITGDIVIDRSFFDTVDRISSGFDKNRYSEYNAMPDAMMFDDHLSKVVIRSNGSSLVAKKSIPDMSYDITNKLVASDKSCKGNRTWPRMLISSEGSRPLITFSGTMSLKCSPRTIRKVITHSYYSFYYALKAEILKKGIQFHGNMQLASIPEGSRSLFIHYAKPLLSILSKTNKKSNNLYARHILLLLGAKRFGAPATEEKGRKAIEEILENLDLLQTGSMYLDNGSGLSRKSRITARDLSEIIQSAHSRFGAIWLKTLSIAGVDGTIRKRFKRSAAKGRAWMKTGTLRDAKNIAGYVRAKTSGTLYSVVVMYNGKEKWKGSALQNQIINWLSR